MNWTLKPKPPKDFVSQFPEYPPLVLQLLYDRGLDSQKKIDEFFSPDYGQDLHDPFLLLDMEKACRELLKAIKQKQKICIFGDYDADGVCGAAILETTIKKLGGQLEQTYIPDRKREGYGLNFKAVKEIAKSGVRLVITVDCGITDWEEIKLAKSLGVETIILDHHRILKEPPKALAVVDPYQVKDRYPFKELSAAGVAFKLACALGKKLGPKKLEKNWEKWLLDLVALATVADCMPLLGENRTLVKYGLIVLAQTKRLGLKELMRVARLSPYLVREITADGQPTLNTNLDTYTLGFILGPRLNAASRMDHANTAYKLLVTGDQEEAAKLAENLEIKNKERQALTEKIFAQAQERVKPEDKIIFEGDKDWPVGVVGLVAGKITEKYHRPSLIFQQGEKVSKGSARSIPKFNIVQALAKCQEFLIEFGGHAGAAGFSIDNKNIADFRKKIREVATQSLRPEDLVPEMEIDCEVVAEQVSWENYDLVSRFAPFGEGNPQPHFLMRNLQIEELQIVGATQKHLKMRLMAPNFKSFTAVGFNLGYLQDKIKRGDKIDLVFEMLANEWNGTRELQLKVKDIKMRPE